MDQESEQQTAELCPRAALEKEVQEYLSQMAQTIRFFDHFCNDLQAAVNELSQFDARRYLDVTLACDHIKDCITRAKQQSEIFINGEQDDIDHTRNRIQKMLAQLCQFRHHRNRIADLYLRGTMAKNPEPRQLEWNLERHMGLLRADVHRLLYLAHGKSQDGDDQAAEDTTGPSQAESHQG